MPIPPYVAELRAVVGTRELWLNGITAVIRRDGPAQEEVLLTRRADNGEWAPVTGISDPGEEPADAARREALEETGVEISVDRVAAVGVSPRITYPNGDRAVYLDVTLACTWRAGEARVADDENLEVRWWPTDALPPMSAWLRGRIEAALTPGTGPRFAP